MGSGLGSLARLFRSADAAADDNMQPHGGPYQFDHGSGHGVEGPAAGFQIDPALAHQFGRHGMGRGDGRLVGGDGAGIADVFNRGGAAGFDEQIGGGDGLHAQAAHEHGAFYLFVDEILRIAAADQGGEEYGVGTGRDMGAPARKQHHGNLGFALEPGRYSGEVGIAHERPSQQKGVGTGLDGPQAGFDYPFRGIGVRIEKDEEKGSDGLKGFDQPAFDGTHGHHPPRACLRNFSASASASGSLSGYLEP